MATIFEDFVQGQRIGSGPRLAAALTPVAPAEYPQRLQSFYRFSNAARVSSDLRYSLFQANGLKLPKQEQNAWIDIFSTYWTAVGEITKFTDSPSSASWVKVFNSWKDLANILIRGYTNFGLQAWTVPCLYIVGKYLRIFAMKADAELSSQDSVAFGDNFQDDIAADFEKSAKLEESARIINRMFTLCLSDRWVSRGGPMGCSTLLTTELEPRLRSRANGAYIIRQICCSKLISRYGEYYHYGSMYATDGVSDQFCLTFQKPSSRTQRFIGRPSRYGGLPQVSHSHL